MTDHEIQDNLANFYGSASFTPFNAFSKSVLTEGTVYLAEAAQAYWLFDAIQSHLHGLNEDMVQSTLTVGKDGEATLELDDMDENIVATQDISYTDFPLRTIKIWSVRNETGAYTHMLPSEY